MQRGKNGSQTRDLMIVTTPAMSVSYFVELISRNTVYVVRIQAYSMNVVTSRTG